MAEPGDDVELAPGEYARGTTVTVPDGVHARGESREARAHIVVSGTVGIALDGPDAKLSDLDVTREPPGSAAALEIGMGSAVRVRADSDNGIACDIGGGELFDSVCRVVKAPTFAYALFDDTTGSHVSEVVNSTLFASADTGDARGAKLEIAGLLEETIELRFTNTIAHSGTTHEGISFDVELMPFNPGLTVRLASRNSNHGPPFLSGAGGGVYNDLGGNQTAEPLFLDPTGVDLRQASGSPTIDAGTSSDVDLGDVDVLGETRVQKGAPDIGAHEAPAQCRDGVDNDGDGHTDFPDDPGCDDALDDDERNPADGQDETPTPLPGPKCKGKQATLIATPGQIVNGTARRDVIVGTPGRERIRALGGNDLVCGRGGNDVIHGGKGRDVLLGQGGRDLLRGQGARDFLFGGAGPDRLFGDFGRDALRGGPGRDLLIGGPAADRLFGGPGPDVLIGARGRPDLCDGQGGRDRRRAPGCERRRRIP